MIVGGITPRRKGAAALRKYSVMISCRVNKAHWETQVHGWTSIRAHPCALKAICSNTLHGCTDSTHRSHVYENTFTVPVVAVVAVVVGSVYATCVCPYRKTPFYPCIRAKCAKRPVLYRFYGARMEIYIRAAFVHRTHPCPQKPPPQLTLPHNFQPKEPLYAATQHLE